MSFRRRLVAGQPGRLLLGVLAASLVACLVPLPAMLALSVLSDGGWSEITLGGILDAVLGAVAMIFLWPMAATATIAGGLPVHLLLALIGRQGRPAYALGGAAAGALILPYLVFARPVLPVAGALAGGLAALAFRAIWRP